MSKNLAVFGIYRDRASVDEAMTNLGVAGFRDPDMSVLLQENRGTKDLGLEKHTKAPEGTVIGGIIGVIIGGVLGWLVGIGTIVVPDLQALVAAGPVVAALAGACALGILGGIIGAIAGSSSPEYEAKRYNGRVKQGGLLLSLHCDDHAWAKRAKEMLRQTGAEGIACATESRGDFSVSERPMPRVRPRTYSDPLAGPDSTVPTETETSYRNR